MIVDVKSRSYPISVDVSERSRALKKNACTDHLSMQAKKYTSRNSNPKTLMKVSHFCHRDIVTENKCVFVPNFVRPFPLYLVTEFLQ